MIAIVATGKHIRSCRPPRGRTKCRRMKSRIALVRTAAILLAAGSGLLAGLGLLGGYAMRLDAFAAFRWHATALLVFAVLAAVWPRRALPLALAAPPVIFGVPIIASLQTSMLSAMAARPTGGPASPPSSLRIMTFNTWDQVRNIDEIHALLRETKPDVAVLVEVSPPKRALLEVLKPLYPYQVECAKRWPCSMALISRIPFEAQGTVMPHYQRPSTVWGRIAYGADALTIIGVHIHRPTRSPRIHWGHMRGLAEIVREANGRVIVAGDFNMPVESAIYRANWSGFTNAFSCAGWGFGATKATGWHGIRIDHVLLGPGWTCLGASVGPDLGLDHRPMMVDLSWQGTQ